MYSIDSIESLIKRKQELEDRRNLLEFEKIKLNATVGELTEAEAALAEQKVLAAMADNLIERQRFKERFCQLYEANKSLAEAIEGVAEAVMTVITQLYPAWLTNLWTAYPVATLAAVVLIRKIINLYCEMIGHGNKPKPQTVT